MNGSAFKLLDAALDAVSLDDDTRGRIRKAIREAAAPRPPAAREDDRLIRRAEAARLLARTTRAVDLLARGGVLKRVRLPGRSRGAGFRLSDVQRLLNDNTTQTA
jgi:hypothetical protein